MYNTSTSPAPAKKGLQSVNKDGRENGSRPDGPDEASVADEAGAEVASAVIEPGEEPTNVLRFPKNWFGPTEDLVPFGPRAEGGAAASEAPVVELTPPSSATADDFWGEASAAVHAAVEAPDRVPRVARPVRIAWIAAGVAIAALAGVVLVVSMAATSGGHRVAGRVYAALSAHDMAAIQMRVPHPVRTGSRVVARRPRGAHRRARPHRAQNAAVILASREPSSSAASPAPATSPAERTTTAYRSSSPAVVASSDHPASASTQSAGPTGPVSLVGPGTTPSG